MMKQRVRLALFVGSLAMFGFAGCESQSNVKEDKAQAEEPKEQQQKQADKADKDRAGKSEKMAPHSSSIPGTLNQLKWDEDVPEVDFQITNPSDGATVEGERLAVDFEVDGYRIGKEIGQHVHFVLDNQPYRAHYKDGEPIVYEDLEEGTHTLRAFPSRHYHLSLKEGRPIDTVVFHVGEESQDFGFDPTKPYLTYSRPKGTYSAEAADNLLLDFYLSNVELGEDARVVYSVDGETRGELTEWKPVLLTLKPGEHEVNLKLVDGEGNLIQNGGYNDTTRTITVKEPK